jgi:type IV pilus biogenesis protein CpaD/CtpE
VYTQPTVQVVFNDLCAEDPASTSSSTVNGASHCVTVASSALSEWEHVRSQVARKAVSEQDVAAAIKVSYCCSTNQTQPCGVRCCCQ